MNQKQQLEDDMIADPDIFEFTSENVTPDIVLRMMASNANQSIKQSILLDSMAKTIAKVEATLDKLVDNDNKRNLQHQETLSNIKRIDKDVERVEATSVKALDKVDLIEDNFDESCNATKEEIEDGINTKVKIVLWGLAMSAILAGYIFNKMDTAQIKTIENQAEILKIINTHKQDTKVHKG